MIPIIRMTIMEGIMADGAFPNAAIPAGNDRPPLPTIFLMRLTIKFAMLPLPVPQASVSKRHFGENLAWSSESSILSWKD